MISVCHGAALPWAHTLNFAGKFVFASPLVIADIILLKGLPGSIPLTTLNNEARTVLAPLLKKYGIQDVETIKIYSSHNPIVQLSGAFAFQDVREKGIIISHDFLNKDPLFIEAIIGHEVCHIINNHVLKRSGLLHAVAAVTGSVGYALNKYVTFSHPLLEKMNEVEALQYLRIFMPYYLATLSYGLMSNSYCRSNVFEADDYVVKYANNPAVIKALIDFLKKDYEIKKSIYDSFSYKNGMGSHPHPLKRIERLEAALQNML